MAPSEIIVINLPGPVVGKGRPKFARLANGGISARTPEKTRSYEACLKYAANAAMAGRSLMQSPVSVAVTISVSIPTGWPTWKRSAALEGGVRPTTKPDSDNCLKIALDAFNGIVYRDDTQVVSVSMEKIYAEKPGLVVTVTPLGALAAQVTKRPCLAALGRA